MAVTRITSRDIKDDVIVNADVNSAAAIAESKLALDDSTGHKHAGSAGSGTKVEHGTVGEGKMADISATDHHSNANDPTSDEKGALAGEGTPSAANKYTTKSYVDGLAAGLDWQESVKDKDLNDPPGSPGTGDRYIVGGTPTGAWAGHAKDVTEYNGASWDFVAKNDGMATFVEDEELFYFYDADGDAWNKLTAALGAHASTHENGGADEVSVADLSGELADVQKPKGGTPALTLSTTNAEGTGNAVLTGATVAAFDATVPDVIQPDDAAAAGSAAFAARRDHTHGIVAAVAVKVGDANAEGDSTSFARANHVHEKRYTPATEVRTSGASTWVLSNTPAAGTLVLSKNGLVMKLGAGFDYTIATATITFLTGQVPETGDEQQAVYWY